MALLDNQSESDLHVVCERIYALLGQGAVIRFIDTELNAGSIAEVSWGHCEPCEHEESPIYEGLCLVCGSGTYTGTDPDRVGKEFVTEFVEPEIVDAEIVE